MTPAFILQDGVPLEPVRRRPSQPHQPWKDAINAAEIGQFFFVPDRKPKSVSAYIARITTHTGRKFETRRTWAWFDHAQGIWRVCTHRAEGAQEGVGVWRTA